MSQVPPPPPNQPGPTGASGAASNKKIYSILAYLFTWVGGIIFLFVGKDDPDVKWNAAQSIVIFGGLQIAIFIFAFIPILGWLVVLVLWLATFVLWVMFLIQGLQGNGEKLSAPVIGPTVAPLVQSLVNAVN